MKFMLSIGPTRDLPVLQDGEEAGEKAYVNEVLIVGGVDAETALPEGLKEELRELLSDALTIGPMKKSKMAATQVRDSSLSLYGDDRWYQVTLSDVVWCPESGDAAVLKDEVIRMFNYLMKMVRLKLSAFSGCLLSLYSTGQKEEVGEGTGAGSSSDGQRTGGSAGDSREGEVILEGGVDSALVLS